MLGGGLDREDLELLDPDGNRPMDAPGPNDFVGCHVGEFAGLNINPQPGYHYCWANDNPRSLLRVAQRGGELVQAGDPEMAAYEQFANPDHTPLDSTRSGYPGVKLVRTPIEVERRRREEEAHRRAALLRGGHAEQSYTQRGIQYEDEQRYQRHNPLRFVRDDHMIRVTAGPGESDRTVDMWHPGAGIVREG